MELDMDALRTTGRVDGGRRVLQVPAGYRILPN
jgi:hypothetical protein